ncbi:16579_t:CDS:10, partial [Acaulospora morrowiae]
IYTLSLHDALPIWAPSLRSYGDGGCAPELVKSEISNKSLMYCWQNIVNKKEEKSVINNHISGSLKILDATAKHTANTIVSKVSNLREIDADVNERSESDDDFRPPKKSTKRKKNLSLRKSKESVDSAVSKKVRTTMGMPSLPVVRREATAQSNSSNKSSIVRYSSSNSESGGATGITSGINEINSLEYDRSHTPPHQIRSASENQDLLKRLRQEKQRTKSTEPICSNIIDTTNKLLMNRLKIKRDYTWDPVTNEATKYIDELIDNSDTRDKFRCKLQLSYVPPDETYSFSKHYEIKWVHCFADKLASFFEAPRNPLLNKNSEGWLNCHILASLIEDCFLTCEEIQVHRGEEMSLASIERKNLSREESEKKQYGHKIDIIFRIDDIEYFGSETYADEDSQNSKPISYKQKLFREMKDQLDRLLKKLKFTRETIKEIKNIAIHGINQGGHNGKIYAMYYDNDLQCYFVFETCRYRIGTTWGSIPESLMSLKDILCLKTRLSILERGNIKSISTEDVSQSPVNYNDTPKQIVQQCDDTPDSMILISPAETISLEEKEGRK